MRARRGIGGDVKRDRTREYQGNVVCPLLLPYY
jgi:hypothetical protein